MKKFLLLSLIIVLTKIYAQDQIFKSKQLTFYGLDFTNAQFIGTFGFNQKAKIQDFHFPDWNYMFEKERRKYNLSDAFRMKQINYDFSIVNKRNSEFDIYEKISDEDFDTELGEEDIRPILKAYANPNHKGLGLLMVVESMSYFKNLAVVWLCFFDSETGDSYLIKRIRGEAGGLNFRNWWARSFYNVLESAKLNYPYWIKS
ncbi:MAG: hypothetical protein JXR60_04445 [Bacteroidales bacterium]|nr:hypothetical protein [Bacteroidales bacterium]